MKQASQLQIPASKMYVIGAALHVSILIYVFVVFFLAKTSSDWTVGWSLKEGNEILLYAFGAASFMTGTFSLLAPKFMKGGPSPQPATPHEVVESSLFFDFSEITQRVLTLSILRMALAESIAIFGFVLAFLNQATHWILPFAAVGLLLQILVGPFGRFLRGA